MQKDKGRVDAVKEKLQGPGIDDMTTEKKGEMTGEGDGDLVSDQDPEDDENTPPTREHESLRPEERSPTPRDQTEEEDDIDQGF